MYNIIIEYMHSLIRADFALDMPFDGCNNGNSDSIREIYVYTCYWANKYYLSWKILRKCINSTQHNLITFT